MSRAAWLGVGAALAALLAALAGCSTSPPDDGPPVADPGGPFRSSVAAGQRIDGLTLAQGDTLCRELANASYAFLAGAIGTQNVCRETATIVASEHPPQPDGGETCAQLFAECSLQQPPAIPVYCSIPIPSNLPQQCDATVEDLSACINETAAHDPVGTCVTTPACDGGASMDASSPPPSALPACQRLHRICPGLDQYATFPC